MTTPVKVILHSWCWDCTELHGNVLWLLRIQVTLHFGTPQWEHNKWQTQLPLFFTAETEATLQSYYPSINQLSLLIILAYPICYCLLFRINASPSKLFCFHHLFISLGITPLLYHHVPTMVIVPEKTPTQNQFELPSSGMFLWVQEEGVIDLS